MRGHYLGVQVWARHTLGGSQDMYEVRIHLHVALLYRRNPPAAVDMLEHM